MDEISTICIIPLLVTVVGGIAVVVFEYFFVQPVKNSIDISIMQSQIDRDWSTAMRKALNHFRAQHYGVISQWIPKPNEKIIIDDWGVKKGQATLIISVNNLVETYSRKARTYNKMPVPISRHKITVDRSGDIIGIEFVPLENEQDDSNLGSDGIADILSMFPKTYRSSPINSSEPVFSITRKSPVVAQRTSTGMKVTIKFEIENRGKTGKTCPYIEFKLLTSRDDGKFSPKPYKYQLKPIEIPSMRKQEIQQSFEFLFPEIPLVEPPHKVIIELRSC